MVLKTAEELNLRFPRKKIFFSENLGNVWTLLHKSFFDFQTSFKKVNSLVAGINFKFLPYVKIFATRSRERQRERVESNPHSTTASCFFVLFFCFFLFCFFFFCCCFFFFFCFVLFFCLFVFFDDHKKDCSKYRNEDTDYKDQWWFYLKHPSVASYTVGKQSLWSCHLCTRHM